MGTKTSAHKRKTGQSAESQALRFPVARPSSRQKSKKMGTIHKSETVCEMSGPQAQLCKRLNDARIRHATEQKHHRGDRNRPAEIDVEIP